MSDEQWAWSRLWLEKPVFEDFVVGYVSDFRTDFQFSETGFIFIFELEFGSDVVEVAIVAAQVEVTS